MTIAIAFTLPDGVLLIADGRQTYPLDLSIPLNNDIDKLEQISATIFAIPFGITHATNFSLKLLKNLFGKYNTPEKFSSAMRGVTMKGFQYLINKLQDNIDVNHACMKAGLIAGGILNEDIFIAGYVCSTIVKNQPLYFKNDPFKLLIIGGEKQEAKELLIRKFSIIRQNTAWENNVGPINLAIRELLDESSVIIREIESNSLEIGGTIRYVVIRKGFEIDKNILEMNQ